MSSPSSLHAVTVLFVLVRSRTFAPGKRIATGGGGARGMRGARLSRRMGKSADDESPARDGGTGAMPGTPENQPPVGERAGSAIHGALDLRPIFTPSGGEAFSQGAEARLPQGFEDPYSSTALG